MESTQKKLLIQTFLWMFLGLLGTGIVAYYTYASELYIKVFSSTAAIAILCIAEVLLVLLFSFLFKKLPPVVVGAMFFIYAFINGLTFSTIFVTYEMTSIIYTFFITAGMFALFVFAGSVLNVNISKIGPILLISLITCLIATIINIFLNNGILNIILNIVIILIFAGYTIYDIAILKKYANDPSLPEENKSIYFAMELYLDFINLFIHIIQLIAKEKD